MTVLAESLGPHAVHLLDPQGVKHLPASMQTTPVTDGYDLDFQFQNDLPAIQGRWHLKTGPNPPADDDGAPVADTVLHSFDVHVPSFVVTTLSEGQELAWSPTPHNIAIEVTDIDRVPIRFSSQVYRVGHGFVSQQSGPAGFLNGNIGAFYITNPGDYWAEITLTFLTEPYFEHQTINFTVGEQAIHTATLHERFKSHETIADGSTYYVEIGASYADIWLITDDLGETVTATTDGAPEVAVQNTSYSFMPWSARVWGFFDTPKTLEFTSTWPDGQEITRSITIAEVPPKTEGIHTDITEGQQLDYLSGVSWSFGDEDQARTLTGYSYSLDGPSGQLLGASLPGSSVSTTQTYSREDLLDGNYTIRISYQYDDGTEDYALNFEVLPLPATPPAPMSVGIYPADARVGRQLSLVWADSEPTRTQVAFEASINSTNEPIVLGSLTHFTNAVARDQGSFEIAGRIEYDDGFETDETHSITIQPAIAPELNDPQVLGFYQTLRISWVEHQNVELADSYDMAGVSYLDTAVSSWGGSNRYIDIPYPAATLDIEIIAYWPDGPTAASNQITFTPIVPAAIVDEKAEPLTVGPNASHVLVGNAVNAAVNQYAQVNVHNIGLAKFNAGIAETTKWDAIFNDPNVSAQTKAVSDSAAQFWLDYAHAGLDETNLYLAQDNAGGDEVASITAHVFNQYLAWINAANGQMPTTPFIPNWPSK